MFGPPPAVRLAALLAVAQSAGSVLAAPHAAGSVLAAGFMLPAAHAAAVSTQEPAFSVVPWPLDVQLAGGSFELNADTRIVASDPSVAELQRLAAYLARPIREDTGLPLEIGSVSGPVPANAIVLALEEGWSGPTAPYARDESYRLRVDPERIVITARTPAGLFYGIQTLRQLLRPPAIRIAAVDIRDRPRFRYRGMHLDVGRHFFSVAFIKRYIDLLAMYKLNTFHWHLTEDQGWRIAIDAYPRLAEVASCRTETIVEKNFDPYVGDGTPYCGYYTKDEIRAIVAYAAERYVNVIPEVEMPGHSLAALAAYPELACTEGPFAVGTRWGVFEDILCPTEGTFAFLEAVLDARAQKARL